MSAHSVPRSVSFLLAYIYAYMLVHGINPCLTTLHIQASDRCCMQNVTDSKIQVDPFATKIDGRPAGTKPTQDNPIPPPFVQLSYNVNQVRGPPLTVLAAARLFYTPTSLFNCIASLCIHAQRLKQSCVYSSDNRQPTMIKPATWLSLFNRQSQSFDLRSHFGNAHAQGQRSRSCTLLL